MLGFTGTTDCDAPSSDETLQSSEENEELELVFPSAPP